MGFISLAGRVLFSSIFILVAWQRFNEFGDDGGPAVKLLEPKYELFKNHLTATLGFQVPEIEIKHLVGAEIVFVGNWFLPIFLALNFDSKNHDGYNISNNFPK
ncbi:hypothetical protein AMTRI_Chr01g133140 [Amborella trichopoda]